MECFNLSNIEAALFTLVNITHTIYVRRILNIFHSICVRTLVGTFTFVSSNVPRPRFRAVDLRARSEMEYWLSTFQTRFNRVPSRWQYL